VVRLPETPPVERHDQAEHEGEAEDHGHVAPLSASSEMPDDSIHALPNSAGEYHSPPIMNVERAATSTAR